MRWLYFLALALLVGGLGFRLLVLRGPLPPRARAALLLVAGIGAVAVLEVGIVAFILRAEDALQLPFGRLLYGDLSPIASGTSFGTAFIAMTLGFALVAALLFLAWLTDRTWLLWAAFVLGARDGVGPLAVGPLGRGRGLVAAGRSSPTGCTSRAATLWAGGVVMLAVVGLAGGARAAARRVPPLRPPRAGADRAPAGGRASTSRCCGCRRVRSLDDGLRAGAAREARRSSRSPSPGAPSHHFVVRAARSSAAGATARSAAACSARARSR